jgi:hypothetical protein
LLLLKPPESSAEPSKSLTHSFTERENNYYNSVRTLILQKKKKNSHSSTHCEWLAAAVGTWNTTTTSSVYRKGWAEKGRGRGTAALGAITERAVD